jgi:hypothetical protein
MLAGVNKHIREQLDLTGITEELLGEENIFMVTDIVGESGLAAYQTAQDWLASLEPAGEGQGMADGSD